MAASTAAGDVTRLHLKALALQQQLQRFENVALIVRD